MIEQLFSLITTSPGNLIVHLALAFAIMATLQAITAARKMMPPASLRRLLIGLNAILLGQLVLFASSGLTWQNIADPHGFMPPLDRAVAAWSLVWIVWLWIFPRNPRLSDGVNALTNLVIILGFLFSVVGWMQISDGLAFNGTWYDWGWAFFTISICFAGLVLLGIQRPEGWGIGAAILLLNLIGWSAHILIGDVTQDFSAWARLAQLCTYPLLPALAQRHALASTEGKPAEPALPTFPEEKRRHSLDPRAVHAWLELANQTSAANIRSTLTRAIAQTLTADLCFLAPAQFTGGKLILMNGYDLLRDEELQDISLDASQVPGLASSVQRARPLRLSGDSSSSELDILASALSLEQPGSLLTIPLANGQEAWGAILLLSPYSNRSWSTSDQNFLLTASNELITLLKTPVEVAAQQPSYIAERLKESLTTLQGDYERLQAENASLLQRLEEASSQPAPAADSAEMSSLLAVQKESEEVIARLQDENRHLQNQLEIFQNSLVSDTTDGAMEEAVPGSESQVSLELRLALEEVAHLQNAVAGANMKILALEMQTRHGGPSDNEHMEVIASTVQELRQPITSIIGYTDLIMSETVGILGALQRKFMERIRASTERMRSLLDDLIMVTVLEGKPVEINPDRVDVFQIIDRAVAATSAQFRERDLALELDLPESLPPLMADQDAMEQIMVHLLQNAAAVTQEDGVIVLKASVTDSESQPYLLVQVTDAGGGIAPEDLSRVFWRHYRADNPLIQGIGDKGVGLSIARTLVEAMGGRIWVESQPGVSATFSVLLPITPDQENDPIIPNESTP